MNLGCAAKFPPKTAARVPARRQVQAEAAKHQIWPPVLYRHELRRDRVCTHVLSEVRVEKLHEAEPDRHLRGGPDQPGHIRSVGQHELSGLRP